MGFNAGYSTTTGLINTFLGGYAGYSNTTASNNTAVGYQAAYSNTTGSPVDAFGYQSLYKNTTGAGNLGVGSATLQNNTTGSYNVAVGYLALFNNTVNNDNSALGVEALTANTTGTANTGIGRAALKSNTTASNNTAVGYQAGYTNTTATGQVFIGYQAGYTSNGNYNVCIGPYSGYSLTTGTANTFVGTQFSGAGYYVTTGSYNSILGSYNGNQGGLDIRTASNYIVLSDGDGNPRGWFDNSGVWNIGPASAAVTFNPSSGYLVITNNGAQSINITAGANGVYLSHNGTSWNAISDERFKENLVPISDAITKVNSLRAVTGNLISDEDKKSRAFLIAQDVQKVLPEAVDETNPNQLGLAYTDVIPLLVAAITELNAKVTALEAKLGA